jgi:hypothetical protein
MTAPLDSQRFRDLADAYGGVVERWPEQYRQAATRFGETVEGGAVLARASALDERLDTWRVSFPSSELAARILASAPSTANGLGTQLRWWWSGLGLAATLAGAVAGTAAVAVAAPVDVSSSTSFGDIAGTDG